MIKLAEALEQTAKYVEALEQNVKSAEEKLAAKSTDEVATPVTREYGDLVAKLASKWDREEAEVLEELNGLSERMVGELRKTAADETQPDSIDLGGASDYVEPHVPTSKTANSDISSEEAWKLVADKWVGNK